MYRFNPCFRRLCYATTVNGIMIFELATGFNPCFRRLCYATNSKVEQLVKDQHVSILVFVDCVMQLDVMVNKPEEFAKFQSLFSQIVLCNRSGFGG